MAEAASRPSRRSICSPAFSAPARRPCCGRLLADPALAGTAVLINEFGEVGLDHHLLERIDETVVLLRSGVSAAPSAANWRGRYATCIRGGSAARCRRSPAGGREHRPGRSVSDPGDPQGRSGSAPSFPGGRGHHHGRRGERAVADRAPHRIDPASRGRRPAGVDQDRSGGRVTVANAAGPRAADQPGRAGDPRGRSRCRARCSIIGAHPYSVVSARRRRSRPGSGHAARIRSFVVTVEEPIDWTAFGIWLTMLLNRHGDKVLRVKGILNLAGEAAPVAIHGVQHLVHNPVHMAAGPTTTAVADRVHRRRHRSRADPAIAGGVQRELACRRPNGSDRDELRVSSRAACAAGLRHRP